MKNRACGVLVTLIVVVSVSLILPNSILAYGESGSEYISGPSGDKVNEWYKGGFSILFYFRNDSGVSCSTRSTGQYNWVNNSAPSGSHFYRFVRANYSGLIWYQIDGGSYMPVTPWTADPNCHISHSSVTEIFSETIYVDNSPATVRFDPFLNNLHTKDTLYNLTGTVSDDNGPITVKINGKSAGYVMGKSGSFSQSFYLDKPGPHIFTATATDDAGRTSTSTPITIY